MSGSRSMPELQPPYHWRYGVRYIPVSGDNEASPPPPPPPFMPLPLPRTMPVHGGYYGPSPVAAVLPPPAVFSQHPLPLPSFFELGPPTFPGQLFGPGFVGPPGWASQGWGPQGPLVPPPPKSSSSYSDKDDSGKKKRKEKAPKGTKLDGGLLPGLGHLYPAGKSTTIHVIRGGKMPLKKILKGDHCEFLDKNIYQTHDGCTVNEVMDMLEYEEGAKMTQVFEKGNGMFVQGTMFEYGSGKAKQTLKALGWNGAGLDKAKEPIWIVLQE